MPTDAEIADQLRKLVKELDRMDRREDYYIRRKLREILDGTPIQPADGSE